MANVDFPRGFRPVRNKNGVPLTCEYYDIGTTAIFKNDAVERRSDGLCYPAQASSVTIVGVAAEYKAANSTGQIAVYPAQGLVMEAQSDDASIAAQTDLGLNYNIVATAGSTTTGLSAMEIDGSTGATTATLPILVERVVDLRTQVGNSLGANVLLECVFNANAYNGGGTGV